MTATTSDRRPGSGTRARLRVGALLGVEAAAVAALHAAAPAVPVEWADLPRWLALTPPVDALVAALRIAGLAVGWWLLASTSAYALSRLARLPRLALAVARLTAPAVRRRVDRAIAAGVTATVLATAPVAGPAAVAEVAVPDSVVAGTAGEVAVPDTVVADTLPLPDVAVRDARDRVHVVRPGEHLWAIARGVVAEAGGRDPGAVPPRAVAPYWLRLVEANRDGLASGDPDRIHPGERVVLPPLDAG